jgi:hypothetical protein
LLNNGISVENSTVKYYTSGAQIRFPQIALSSLYFYILKGLKRQFNRTITLNIEALNLNSSEKTDRNDDYDDKNNYHNKNNRTKVTATNTTNTTTTTTTTTTTNNNNTDSNN